MTFEMAIALFLLGIALGVCITYNAFNKKLMKKMEEQSSENEEIVNKIKKDKEEAIKENLRKDEYLASVIHDIRTPINAVNGMTELILRENNNKTITEYANSIKRAGNILNQLANDVLDISKIDSGNMELVEDSYDIVEVFSDVISLTKDKCNKKALKFEVRIDEKIPTTLYGDENRLRQILMNLLSNAVKYTAQGKVLLEAKLKNELQGDKAELYFAVEDTGAGIKEEDLETVFQSFKRVEELKNNMIEGTGLGLTIVSKMLEIMGSKIQVKSKHGVGSRFYFTISQGVIDSNSVGNFIAKYNDQLDKKSNYIATFVAPKAHILVVDDNEMNLVVASKLLEETQMTVDVARSGMKCLEAITKKKYNLILMDVKMPELDGVETLKRIRGGGTLNKQTPVIALTADAFRGVREKYLDEGFSDYISKPYDPIKLERKIMRYIPNTLIIKSNALHTTTKKISLELNVNEGLKYCSGDIDMYNEVLATYGSTGDENIVRLSQDFENCNWRDYGILVHSLKSTSLTVGAVKLYEKAKALEEAVNNDDNSYIIYNHQEMMDIYIKVLAEIKEYFKKENINEQANQGMLNRQANMINSNSITELKKGVEDLDEISIENMEDDIEDMFHEPLEENSISNTSQRIVRKSRNKKVEA